MPQNRAQQEKHEFIIWAKRRDIPLSILGWFAVLAVFITLLSHISHTIFLFAISAILAYALVPAVTFIQRFMPRWLAITLVYIVVTAGLGFIFYLVIEVSIKQFAVLISATQNLLVPKGDQNISPLVLSLERVGFTEQQIIDAGRQLTTQLENVTSSILPIIQGLFSSIIDILVTAIISIYLLLDGERLINWLKNNMPHSQKGRLQFTLNTMQRIVGGYIRGQFLLSVSIGFLVGIGMFLFQLPYAVLLGLLAFIFSFIPFIGTFISGAACVLIGLTKGWLVALLVLGYFILVHIIEGDILGPRIVGRALGLHPIISILAVITGSEVLGIQGALFAAPAAGIVQAVLVAAWSEWKETHPSEFMKGKKSAVKSVNKYLSPQTKKS
jgi:predicted PurR-regulated permease PerM